MIVALNFIALPNTQPTGAFHYIRHLLNIMSEYDTSGTHFIVYKQKHIASDFFGMPAHADVEYIDVPTLGNGWTRILFEQTLFYRYIKPCDVFYSYCTSFPLLVRAKRVFTLHDVYYLTNPERYGWLQRTYLTLITRLYVRMVDEVLTVSQYSYRQIAHYIPAARNKLKITYNILPAREADEMPVEVGAKPYFLFIGSIQPSKNILQMMEGFTRFNKDGKYQLVIAGKPLHNFEQILKKIEETPNVRYLGYLQDGQVTYLYKHAEAVVLLSLCEGFGIPPLEGFRYGKPALVANATSLPEVVGEAGIKVDPYDINAIEDGFRNVLKEKDTLCAHIPTQLQFFDSKQSCEVWMKSLEIQYAS
jgi:glycosyltransferase involved in cell wall biosynthesis